MDRCIPVTSLCDISDKEMSTSSLCQNVKISNEDVQMMSRARTAATEKDMAHLSDMEKDKKISLMF